jgi:hypothetical protein
MSTQYELRLLDPKGKEITRKLAVFSSLEWTRKVNDVGSFTMKLPGQLPLWWFSKDYRLEIWRGVDDRPLYLEGDTQWLIRKLKIDNQNGERVFTVSGNDLNVLLKRRIVAYDAASVYADKSDYADDMIKEIMSENYGIGCIDGDRDLSAWIDIQGDFSLAFPIEKAFSRRELLVVFQELCQESYENGIYCAFDFVRKTSAGIGFRTYINQRGTDRTKSSPSPLLFGSQYSNFGDDTYEDDGSEEATFIYAGGQGEEATRIIQTAQDNVRIGASPFGRIERFVDARHAKLAASVQDEAEAELRARIPKRKFSGKAVDVDKCRYGLHYKFGDKVTVELQEITLDAYVNTVHVTKTDGQETIDIGLEAEW